MAGALYVQNVPVGTLERFYRNTVDISENSENHLKAIVGGREVAGGDGVSGRGCKRGQKDTGRRKGEGRASRRWQLGVGSANFIGLHAVPPFRKERERMGHPGTSI